MSHTHVCAVAGGRAYCWGGNNWGVLGDGTTTERRAPVSVDTSGALAGRTVTQIGTGIRTGCALTDEPRIYCWGHNQNGRLGLGHMQTSSAHRVPQATLGHADNIDGRKITRMDVQSNRVCFVADNSNYCWGVNSDGQLGDGTTTHRAEPTRSVFLDNLSPPLYW